MLKIKKEEAQALEKMGFGYTSSDFSGAGSSKNVIFVTKGHHRHYYLTESAKALDALIEIRQDY